MPDFLNLKKTLTILYSGKKIIVVHIFSLSTRPKVLRSHALVRVLQRDRTYQIPKSRSSSHSVHKQDVSAGLQYVSGNHKEVVSDAREGMKILARVTASR